ncbi:MAG TPA: succinate dehydrogenase cytochrome b subunit [Thermoanaerobaculia bacterium]|nr:succinate dehydrogenase cytochrome b subunit [Thermoanaerobaculia bacterium]
MKNWFGDFYRSSLGKKAVMAVTGVVMWGFVLLHMTGNLKYFSGGATPDANAAINVYGEWLREVGYPLLPHSGALWLIRVALLVALALHVHAAYALTMMSRRARPQGYERRRPVQIGWAERSIRWSGVAILLFVVYHILHFTTGQAHHDFRAGDVYHNLESAFSVGWVAALYVIVTLLLGMHLYHGLWSMFQSMGWNHPRFNRWRRAFAIAFAVLITVGFIVVPLAIVTGFGL